MAVTDVSICNNALLMIGANSITAMTDNTKEAVACNALYDGTRDTLLQEGSWTFARKQVDLGNHTGATPEMDWTYEFTIPSTVMRIFRKDGARNDYEIFGGKLYSNEADVKIIALVDPGEASYPAHFVRSLELKMASILAATLEHDESMAQLFERMHIDALRKSRRIDSQVQPNKSVSIGELTPVSLRG